jgi:(2S)-methylsuccinyl-CoA dehydrogenase
MTSPVGAARSCIDAVDDLLQTMLSSLKHSLGGDLSTAKLDSVQIVSYELAMLRAETYAARAMLDYAEQCLGDGADAAFEVALACCCIADIICKVRARTDKIRFTLGLEESSLQAVFAAPATREFLHEFLDPARIAATGHEALAQMGFGRSQLPEEKAIIAASFARFSDEVVAPLAEKIHRDDLTVPEEILAPLREMGCFGLSIPERYGGTSPDSGEDHLAMVVVTEELSRASLAAAGSLITRPEIMSKAI